MVKDIISVSALALLVILVTLAACTRSGKDNTFIGVIEQDQSHIDGSVSMVSATEEQQLRQWDFNQSIAALPIVPRGQSDDIDAQLGNGAKAVSNSPDDEKVLCGFRLPSGWLWKSSDVTIKVSGKLLHGGQFPQDGLDLYPELRTVEGFTAFQQMTPEERLTKYFAAVNPITGRFYGSFHDEQMEPGGIFLEPLSFTGSSEGFVTYEGTDGFQFTTRGPLTGAYRFTVHGDSGEPLYTDVCAYLETAQGN